VVAEADKAYEAALKLAPNHGRAHIMLGMLCNFTGNYKRAIPHLEKGLELPRESRDWWIAADTLVNVYFNQNQPGPARPVLEKLVEVRPDDVSGHYKLGLVYFFANEKDKAKREFARTLELDPSHGDAKAKLAELGG
jgi:tetratricopeptide (TPR) repeat protein